jgi:hypothetical protein
MVLHVVCGRPFYTITKWHISIDQTVFDFGASRLDIGGSPLCRYLWRSKVFDAL